MFIQETSEREFSFNFSLSDMQVISVWMKRREKRKKRGEGEERKGKERGKEEREGKGGRKLVLLLDQIFHVCLVALVKYRVWASSLEKLGHNYKA